MAQFNKIYKITTTNCVYKIINRNFIRKFPINREKEKELPIFQYPTADSKDRRVYTWGLSVAGALGLTLPVRNSRFVKVKYLHSVKYPTRLSFSELNEVKDIACGYGFTAFSIKNGNNAQLFGTGINCDAQIGYHDPRRGHPLEVLLMPTQIHTKFKNNDTKITGLSAGRAHLLILTDNEGVFASGNNAYGQCGRKIISNEDYLNSAYVHNIKNIQGEKIRSIQCGQDHSMFITETGKVYACGWGSDGQLGNGLFSTTNLINQVQGDIVGENIVKLACSVDCVLALNDKGQVFGWGNSEYGQFYNEIENKSQQLNTSIYLSSLKNLGKIVDIASAGSHCMVLNSKGEIYCWGLGILGIGPEVQQSITPLPIPRNIFYNEFHQPSKIIKIATGFSHSAAISESGELFMWGKNKYGQLGFGNEKDQFFPLRVAVPAQVLKVCCGVDHTVAYCKPFI